MREGSVFRLVLAAALSLLVLPLFGCGSDGSSVTDGRETGQVAFGLAARQVAGEDAQAQPIDCAESGIATIQAQVFGPGGELLATGGPWACEDHQGVVAGVPAGADREVVILARDSEGRLLHRGQKSGILVAPVAPSHAGVIELSPFTPVLTAPANGARITPKALVLQWEPVPGAAGYRVMVDDESSFGNPVVDDVVTGTVYIPPASTLSTGIPYYWRVSARDGQGNEGAFSEARSFTLVELTVTIDSPTGGGYTTCDDISFAGSVNTDDSSITWVWSSDRDGTIGTTPSFTTGNLTVGTHRITLTATEGSQETAQDSVDIEVVNSTVSVTIGSPNSGGIFQPQTPVFFSGSATDALGNAISEASFIWSSDLDGILATGVSSFTVSTLRPGTHVITLSVTDSQCPDGDPGSASITARINSRPEVVITRAVYSEDRDGDFVASLLRLEGSAQDLEDGPLTGSSLRWYLRPVGSTSRQFLGTGSPLLINNLVLDPGQYEVILEATDSMGAIGSDTTTLAANFAPTATITRVDYAEDGLSLFGIILEGSANDPEDGVLPASSLRWYVQQVGSSFRQFLGFSSLLNISRLDLGVGVYRFILEATDSFGSTGSVASAPFTINTLPQVTITTAQYFTNTGQLILGGTAQDLEDGTLSGSSLSWYLITAGSNAPQFLGSGTGLTINLALTGPPTDYVIILEAIDSLGGVGNAQQVPTFTTIGLIAL